MWTFINIKDREIAECIKTATVGGPMLVQSQAVTTHSEERVRLLTGMQDVT